MRKSETLDALLILGMLLALVLSTAATMSFSRDDKRADEKAAYMRYLMHESSASDPIATTSSAVYIGSNNCLDPDSMGEVACASWCVPGGWCTIETHGKN